MPWKTPSLIAINMNAEIGGYQSESDDDRKPSVPAPRARPLDEPPGEPTSAGLVSA